MATNWVGPDLENLRRTKGLSLVKIAQNTKIGVRYLEAIERGQFAKLPGGLYDISYIRQYAQAVECDEAALLEHYRDTTEASPPVAGSPEPAPWPCAKTPYSFSLVRWFDTLILRNVSTRKLRKI
ncbi:MAG: helix-turn-helix domain-containing protein [Acidobacteriia bacterium]|nr:helix-turn-helix domain-containing protein [Terriglobia bacterium]